jgi:hypothetical protein
LTYDLKVPKTPRLVGRALRIATEALERERVGAVLQRGIILGAGLGPLRERPASGLVPPTWIAADDRALLPQRPIDLDALADSQISAYLNPAWGYKSEQMMVDEAVKNFRPKRSPRVPADFQPL